MSREGPPGALPRREISIRVAGDPGHGLLFAGYLLAEAALLDRRFVSPAPPLGPAARGALSGGAVRSAGGPAADPPRRAPGSPLLTPPPAPEGFRAELPPPG